MKASVRRFALAAVTLAVSTLTSAYAATQGPSGPEFYTLPSPIPAGNHGDLISYRPATVNLGVGAPATNAWNVLYKSTNSDDAPNVVSGTVIVPSTPWTGGGARPVILYAVGTHGLARDCAPSRQFEKGTDYENANIAAAVKAGYAVLVTDYQGYLNGDASTYLAGASQGHAVLDLFSAATAIPGIEITPSSKAAIWGYSQGGQSAAFAAEQASTYAPNLSLVGVAAGGIPADFVKTSFNLDGNLGAAFLFSAIVGLGQEYPLDIPIDLVSNDLGKQELTKLKSECVFKALLDYQNKSISPYTRDNLTLAQLESIPTVKGVLAAQNLGTRKINVPLYQYHGQADEFIPLDQDVALKRAYCAKFTKVHFDVYPSEHIVTQFQAAPTVLSWVADRFAGKAAPDTCSTTTAEPRSTANPGGGNFVVTLDKWKLDASVGLKTLNQTVVMPATSTFSANADITSQKLEGNLAIPDFLTKLKIIGIPADIGLQITPAGPTTGTVSLDNEGQLHIRGQALVNINVKTVGEFGLNIPFNCKTSQPVVFPLNFDGPVSALGSGGLTFSGTTTFPSLTGCGNLFAPIFSVLMSGPGQKYTFTVSPPAPVKY